MTHSQVEWVKLFHNPLITTKFFLFLIFFIPLGAIAQSQPYKNMLDEPVQYSGPDSLSKIPSEIEFIKIGFFAPNDENNPAAQQLWQGCQMAVEEINQAGGLFKKPIKVFQRWSKNPWGNGSKEMINLVYKDQVWAVIGSIDSETSHIAEQIITKARVPLISPLAGDLSLNHTRIPWIFRLAPSNREQCQWLVEQMDKKSLQKIGIISSTQYDYRIMADEFAHQLRIKNLTPVFRLDVNESVNMADVLLKMKSFNYDALFVSLPEDDFQKFRLEKAMSIIRPWFPNQQSIKLDNVNFIEYKPFIKNQNFTEKFHNRYGVNPSVSAGYGYDSIHLIAEAIKKAGLSRKGIREQLNNIENYEGTMGTIRWDNGGSNKTIIPANH